VLGPGAPERPARGPLFSMNKIIIKYYICYQNILTQSMLPLLLDPLLSPESLLGILTKLLANPSEFANELA
ncbi:MAG: hypothetical protein ACRC67_27445, partial [Inquilinus sp.]|uniref:hypothetical protein n=1 Tax=Inquilinus sp. TaxID=1932117 RepID=UPI003F30D471